MVDINKNIKIAKTLPSTFYVDDKVFEKSKTIFEQSIQPICSTQELSEVTVYPFEYFSDFLSENLVITAKGGEFRCLSNICTHRAHLVASCKDNKGLLQCRYHGRTFDLKGKLKNAPGFEGAENFPTENDDLSMISIFNWNNFLFISLSDDIEVFNKLNQIDNILPEFPYLELCKKPVRNEYILDCHWALYCDNYLEGFHIPYVHKGLNDDMNWKEYKTEIFDEIVLQKATSSNSKDSIGYDREGNIYAYYFFIFPNIMINYYNWGISINIVEPITIEKTRVKYIIYNLKGEKAPWNSSSSIKSVELEDQEVVLSVQKGLKSRYYKSGRFSPELERGVHYFHRMINSKVLDHE